MLAVYCHYYEHLSFIREPIMTLTALSITPSFTELAMFGIPPRYHSNPFSRLRRHRPVASVKSQAPFSALLPLPAGAKGPEARKGLPLLEGMA